MYRIEIQYLDGTQDILGGSCKLNEAGTVLEINRHSEGRVFLGATYIPLTSIKWYKVIN